MRRRLIAALAGLVCGAAGLAASPPVTHVAVYGPRTPAAEAAVASALSTLPGVEVVPGRAVRPLLAEERLPSAPFLRRALARHLNVDLLLALGPRGDSFSYIEGPTGEELFRIREESPEALAASARLLVEELRDVRRLGRWRVAVLDDDTTARSAAGLRRALADLGATVLDRSLRLPPTGDTPAWPAPPPQLPPRTLTVRLTPVPDGVRVSLSLPHSSLPLPVRVWPEPIDPAELAAYVAVFLHLAAGQ